MNRSRWLRTKLSQPGGSVLIRARPFLERRQFIGIDFVTDDASVLRGLGVPAAEADLIAAQAMALVLTAAKMFTVALRRCDNAQPDRHL
jgi:hypothetical protein